MQVITSSDGKSSLNVLPDLRLHMDLEPSSSRCTVHGVVYPVANLQIFLRLVSPEFQFYSSHATHLFICQRIYCWDSVEFPHFACIGSCKSFHGNFGLATYNGTGLDIRQKTASGRLGRLFWGFHHRLLKISKNLGSRRTENGRDNYNFTDWIKDSLNSIQRMKTSQLLNLRWWPACPIRV